MIKGHKTLILIVIIALVTGLACSITGIFRGGVGEEGFAIDPSLENTSLGHQLEAGDVTIESIEIGDSNTQGEILEVIFTNQSEEELQIEILPGLVFEPVDSDEQNLMVLDAVVVTLDPDETISLSPYVICIEADAAVPSSGSAYQLGYLESSDLLDFALCVDQQADGTLDQDDLGLQFAVWSISSGENMLDLPDISGDEGDALSEMLEELEAFSDLMQGLEEMTLGFGEDWLRRCGISIPGEE